MTFSGGWQVDRRGPMPILNKVSVEIIKVQMTNFVLSNR